MIKVATAHLLPVLADLVRTTADPRSSIELASVLLYTAQGHLGAEPGRTTLLAGLSATSWSAGHTYTHCTGSLAPVLLAADDVRTIGAALKPRLKSNKDHETVITTADGGGHIVVAEDPDLFGDGLRIQFDLMDVDQFPAAAVVALLTEARITPAGEKPPAAAARTDLDAALLAPFLAVAKHRAAPLELYRWHQRSPVLVQIGQHYRGAIRPAGWDDESRDAGSMPAGDVYAPPVRRDDKEPAVPSS